MTELPIDINYNKLLDWLISRHHCSQGWQDNALEVRKKINSAIQDMPENDEITKLLQGTYINYFHCLRIVEILKDTEASSKNLFGRYSSQRMKDWKEIVALYEKDSLYLAESGQQLARYVNFEVNGMKKSIEKCRKLQEDCKRREQEQLAASSEGLERYQSLCRSWGIAGQRLKSELVSKAKDIPDMLQRLSAQLPQLKDAVDYYEAFTSFLMGKAEKTESVLPLLRLLIKSGDVTVFEWTNGVAPIRTERPPLLLEVDDEPQLQEDLEIDWGDDVINDITDDIQFEISTVNDVADEVNVARGEEAYTVLEHSKTRGQFVTELVELEAFLQQRHSELTSKTDLVTSTILQNAPDAAQIPAERVSALRNMVNDVTTNLTNEQARELFLIASSPSYVERVVNKLRKVQDDAEKKRSTAAILVDKANEAREEEVSLQEKLQLLKVKTKELQKQLESDISQKYKGRTVHIMGEINTI